MFWVSVASELTAHSIQFLWGYYLPILLLIEGIIVHCYLVHGVLISRCYSKHLQKFSCVKRRRTNLKQKSSDCNIEVPMDHRCHICIFLGVIVRPQSSQLISFEAGNRYLIVIISGGVVCKEQENRSKQKSSDCKLKFQWGIVLGSYIDGGVVLNKHC